MLAPGYRASTGALANSIEAGQHGIVSRGVLFDMPAVLNKDWLEGGEAIYPDDLSKVPMKLN